MCAFFVTTWAPASLKNEIKIDSITMQLKRLKLQFFMNQGETPFAMAPEEHFLC